MLDHWLPYFTALISAVGLLAVFVQLRRGTKQREAQSLVQVFDINRQLITLGFSQPDLFDVLDDATGVDPAREEHYLQLWLNQMWVIHFFLEQSFFPRGVREASFAALEDLAAMGNFRRFWARKRKFYPASFRKMVDDFTKEKEPPTD